MEKLVKYVARVSEYSRRKSEELIKSGKVKINGDIVTELSAIVNPDSSVTIHNEIIKDEIAKIYIALNKPVGYMSDLKDPRGRKLARNLIKINMKVFPVGRLDYHSEGLIIFTNDGEFANIIMHPRYGVEKEYFVKVKGFLKKDDIKKMKEGVLINGELYKIENVRFIREALKIRTNKQRVIEKSIVRKQETGNTWYRITINEGKNRMIRKIGEAIGHPVLKLKRVRIGKLELGNLEPGKYRYFEKHEVFGNSKKAIQNKKI
jgi:23S rRNA pseudouridine2605 synthase